MKRITICILPRTFDSRRLKAKWKKLRARNLKLWAYMDAIAEDETEVFVKKAS